MSLFIANARALAGPDGAALPRVHVRVQNGLIAAIGTELDAEPGETIIDARGRVLMPGFVDAHTHALWAGDRFSDFEATLAGRSYAEIAAAGGGILSTVRAVRAASEEELVERLRARLDVMLREGTTTVEVKSGYGLDPENELKMLRAIARTREHFQGTLVATALLGHSIDPEVPNFVERTIERTLPRVHEEFPDIAIDAFCERSAWTVGDCRRLFERARALGHPLRLHVDQFTRMGGLGLAIDLGIRSVDHLEVSDEAELEAVAAREIFGVMLPTAAFHLNTPYPRARRFLDAGGRLVLASNVNPGSAPCSSLPLTIALAVRHSGVRVEEAIRAVTRDAAELLGLSDRGRIAVGLRADLILLRHTDERFLALEFGGNPVDVVIVRGELCAGASAA